jgi:Zn-dependent protease
LYTLAVDGVAGAAPATTGVIVVGPFTTGSNFEQELAKATAAPSSTTFELFINPFFMLNNFLNVFNLIKSQH